MPLFILITILTTFLGLSGTLDFHPWTLSGIEVLAAVLSVLAGLPVAAFLLAILNGKKNKRDEANSPTFGRISFCLVADKAVFISWFAAAVFLVVATSWTDRVQEWIIHSKTIQFMVASAPALVSLFLIWWANAWRETQRLSTGFKDAVCRFKVHVALIVAPMSCILVLRDSAMFGTDQQPQVFHYLIFASGLLALVVLMPIFLCRILPTQSIKRTSLGTELDNLATKAGARMRDIRIWDTGDRMINALVVGILPATRSVLLSDRLIRVLTLHEIYSVFLHEIGHAKRNHLLIRFLAAGIPFVLTLAAGEILEAERSTTLLVSMLVSILGLTVIARFLEYDADRFACNKLVEFGLDPSAYHSALAKIVADNPKADRHSWLHPRISDRIRRVSRLATIPTSNSQTAL